MTIAEIIIVQTIIVTIMESLREGRVRQRQPRSTITMVRMFTIENNLDLIWVIGSMGFAPRVSSPAAIATVVVAAAWL